MKMTERENTPEGVSIRLTVLKTLLGSSYVIFNLLNAHNGQL